NFTRSGTGSSYCSFYQSNTTGSGYLQLQNNIFSNTGGGYAMYISQTSSINLSDYNDFYVTGAYLGYWSANRTNLAAWQAASAKDPNSVSVLPGFLTATDLHICNPSLNGAGFPVSEINTDIDGTSRNIFTPDIGADEFSTVLTINWPTDTTICGTGVLNAGNPGSTYLWSTGASTQTIVVSSVGNYSVTITNACGSINDNVNVAILSALVVDIGNDTTVCNSSSIILNAENPSSTYNWSTGATSQTINVTTPGTYYVEVTNGGCSGSDTISVDFGTSPTSTFNMASTACAMNSITATYTGTGSALAIYTWDFDGGSATPGNGQGPHDITWSAAGTYNVALTVEEDGCISTPTIIPVTVQSTPTNTFTVSSATVCAGSSVTVTYTGTGSAGASYAWNFGSGSITSGSGQGPYVITYSTSGNENITLIVSESGCASPLNSTGVTVNSVPTSNFSVSSTAICSNSSITVTYTGTGTVSAGYNWDFEGGFATPGLGMGPHTVNWVIGGNYDVSLVVTENSCTSTPTTINIDVQTTPTSTFTVNPSTICAYDTAIVTYSGNSSGGAIYNWGFSSGTILSGSGQGPYEIYFTGSGIQTLSLTVSENGCVSTVSTNNVDVLSSPTSSFTVSTNSICTGELIDVSYTGSGTGSAIYSWNFNGAIIYSGIGQGPYELTWNTEGTSNISLQVTESGCSSPATAESITVNQTPTSVYTIDNPVCVGDDAIVTYTGNANITAIYLWDFDGATSAPTGQGPHAVNWAADGIVNVSLAVTENGCYSDTTIIPVTVNPAPAIPTINQGGNTLASSASTGNQWYFNGAPIGGATGQFYTATQSGFYQVEVTNVYGCTAISDMLNVTVVSIEDITFENTFSLFPNPNSGEFTIVFTLAETQGVKIKITDVLGKTVYLKDLKQFSGEYINRINISDCVSGVYNLEIITKSFINTRKLIIK
ncbi:MAG: T9SS type A sorting domain-containing protein, partial [Bacteroidota bacterium]